MEEEMRDRQINWRKILHFAEPFILIVLIITLIFFIYEIQDKKAQCVANPLTYAAKILSEQNKAEFSCQCRFDNDIFNVYIVNQTGLWFQSFGKPVGYGLNYSNDAYGKPML